MVGLESTPFLDFVESNSWPGHPQGYISRIYKQQFLVLLLSYRDKGNVGEDSFIFSSFQLGVSDNIWVLRSVCQLC